MLNEILNHIREKKHPYTIIVLMLLLIGGISIFNNYVASDRTSVAIETQVAQVDYKPLAPLPGQESVGTTNTVTYLQNIIYLGIGIAIVLAVLMLVIGGVQYMASDAFTSKEDAKDRMTMALWGLIIALGGYLLLNTINPQLITFKLPSGIGINITTPSATPPVQKQIEQLSVGKPGERINLKREDGVLLGSAVEVLDPTKNNGAVLKMDVGSLAQNKTEMATVFQKQCDNFTKALGKPFGVITTDRLLGIGGTTHTCIPK